MREGMKGMKEGRGGIEYEKIKEKKMNQSYFECAYRA